MNNKLDQLAEMLGSEYMYEHIVKPNVKYLDTQFSESNGWHLYSKDDIIDENFIYLIATAEEGGIMQYVIAYKNGNWCFEDIDENKTVLYYKKLCFSFE